MGALLVPPFKLNSTTEIVPRSTGITTLTGNSGGLTFNGGTATSDGLAINANNQTFAFTNTGRISLGERVTFNKSATASGNVTDAILLATGTSTTGSAVFVYPLVSDTRIIRYSVSQTFSQSPTLNAAPVFTPTANALSDVASIFCGFASGPTYKPDVGVGNSATTALLGGFSANAKAAAATTGSGTVTELFGIKTWGLNFLSFDVNSGQTVTNLYHVDCSAVLNNGTVTNQFVVNMPDQTVGTNIRGLNSAFTSASNKFWIYHSGTCDSAHFGNIKFGAVTAPTALIDLAAGQANHIRMAGHTAAPASPTAGDFYYDTTQKTHQHQSTIGKEGTVGLVSSNTADSSTISNTASETNYSLNFQLPANSLTVNKVIRITATGIYSTTLTPTLQLKVKYGTTTLIDFGALLCASSVSNRAFSIQSWFVVRTIGGTGTVMAHGLVSIANGSTLLAETRTINNAGTTTIDTTAATNLQISAQWSAGSVSDTTTLENFIVEAMG